MNSVLASLRLLRSRLQARDGSEHEQANLRIILLGLVYVYLWAGLLASVDSADGVLLHGVGAFLGLAVLIFVAICIWPAPNVPRRVLGMLVDVGAITWAMFLSGEAGVGLIGVYLFIIFGNGFRYGRKHLAISQSLSVVGFGIVLLFAPWWRDHSPIGLGLMIMLVIIPFYVSVLLHRVPRQRGPQST